MANWAIVGASGFVGCAIVALLEANGHSVTRVVAPRLSLPSTMHPQEVIASMGERVREFRELMEELVGHDVIVNAAGMATPDNPETPELYGANGALPVLLALLTTETMGSRFIHISSAAVQGRSPILDDSFDLSPYSPYSRSKALGEVTLRRYVEKTRSARCEVCIVRATSVQGVGRRTTQALVAFARSPLSSVAGSGDAPSPVSTVEGLALFVMRLGIASGSVPLVAVQPWEGKTVRDVLVEYGGKEPLRLPSSFCRVAVRSGYLLAKIGIPRIAPIVRRVEVAWFGQRIASLKSGSRGDGA